MNTFVVYYMNVPLGRTFTTRDKAMDFIIMNANLLSNSLDDYEILDGSDFL